MSNDVQFNLRIPLELKQQIADAAKNNSRSVNAEAQMRLEGSFDNKDFKPKILVTDYDGLHEPAMTLEIAGAVIGLMQSKYHEVKLQDCHNGTWMLIYHALRLVPISESTAKLLISKGCTQV